MSSRQRLASVADGVANAFANRGNDVDGWWVPSLLLSATTPATPDYSIDLLTGIAVPAKLPDDLDTLGPAWARYFSWSLQRHGVPAARVLTAHLALGFDREVEVASHLPSGRDHPFFCSVRIEDDLGRLHERTGVGHCSRPEDFTDPNPDWRPRRSAAPYDPGRIDSRVGSTSYRPG